MEGAAWVTSNSTNCVICGRASVTTKSSVNNAKVCEACKKFNRRVRGTDLFRESCMCHAPVSKKLAEGECPICRPCRARKLRSLLSNFNDCASSSSNQLAKNSKTVTEDKINFTLIPCEVCGASSNGLHYGAMTCEGCKSFFRRAVLHNRIFKKCKFPADNNGSSTSTTTKCSRIDQCKCCRLKACIDCGMSSNLVRRGRHSLQTRVDIKERIGARQMLAQPVRRRARRYNSEESVTPSQNSSDNNNSNSPRADNTEFIQKASEAGRYLRDIFAKQIVDLVSQRSPQLTPQQMWQMAVSGSIETTVKAVSSFVCSLTGFSQLNQKTRRKLFTFSYFPILFAKLTLSYRDYRSVSAAGRIFAMKDVESLRAFSAEFPNICDRLQRHFAKLASATQFWTPSPIEFVLFCGLLLFNHEAAAAADESDKDKVRHFRKFYFDMYTLQKRQHFLEIAKFNEMIFLFQSSTGVFADILKWSNSFDPGTLPRNPIWAEMYQLMT